VRVRVTVGVDGMGGLAEGRRGQRRDRGVLSARKIESIRPRSAIRAMSA
jgi:hypothetical protein